MQELKLADNPLIGLYCGLGAVLSVAGLESMSTIHDDVTSRLLVRDAELPCLLIE